MFTLLTNTTSIHIIIFFFFQAEDGIRDLTVTGVQTCALPIYPRRGFTHSLGDGSRCLCADGFEKFFARNGSSTALHDHQAARDVGDVRGFERRSPAGERQSVCGKNGVARAGDVYGLIAAMNGDLPESIAWFEKNRAVPSTGDQKRLQFH